MQLLQVVLNKVFPKHTNFRKYLISLLLLISAGACMCVGVPILAKILVKHMCVLKPGSFLRNIHEQKIPFTYKLYLWNVTNADEVAAGTNKPKMQEIGPYVFSQFKQKLDIIDNDANDTLSYDSWNIYHFNPQLSAPLTGDEIFTNVHPVIVQNTILKTSNYYILDVYIHISYLPVTKCAINMEFYLLYKNGLTIAATVKIKLERPHYMDILRESMDTIFENPSSIFTTTSALDFIYKGYEINCKQSATAARSACAELRRTKTLTVLNDEKTLLRYRWFDRLNNSIQARYTVLRGSKNIHDIGRLLAVNDKPSLKYFKEDPKCNTFNGTDKLFYPALQKKRDIIWVYSHDACKSFPLRYQYMKAMRGTNTAWKCYTLGDSLLSPTCECDSYIGCSLRGTMSLYPCLDVFLLGSSPHFYLSEPSIFNTLEGMNPTEHLHEGGIYFDLLSGVPILTKERFQVSWLVKRVPEYPIFNSIAGDLWIPLFWYEETFSIETSVLVIINSGRISKIMGIATGYILIAVGFIGLIALALRFHYHTSVTPQEETEVQQAN